LNPVDYGTWECYKTRITYLDEPKQQLRTKQAKLDHVVIAAAIRQWHRQSVQISDACFVHVLLLYSAHRTRYNGFKSGEF